MSMTTSISLNVAQKLKRKSYFHKFFAARLKDEIATQIKDLRRERGLNQSKLAERVDMKQSAISRIEQAEYASWSFKTLTRLAEVLDARLTIGFIPRELVIREFERERVLAEGSVYSALDHLAVTLQTHEPTEVAVAQNTIEQKYTQNETFIDFQKPGYILGTVPAPRGAVAGTRNI